MSVDDRLRSLEVQTGHSGNAQGLAAGEGARGWARAELSTQLAAPTHEELEWLAHTTYSRARDVWLARAGDDEEPVDLEATG